MRILFVGHNTSYSGAPKSLLRIMTYLKKDNIARFDCLLRNGGPMKPEYEQVCEVYEFLPDHFIPVASQPLRNVVRAICLRWHRRKLLAAFKARNYDVIYSNTVVNANVIEFLSVLRLPVIAHLREMHTAIEAYGGRDMIALLDRFTIRYVAVSQTAKGVLSEYGVAGDKIEVVYNFLEKSEIEKSEIDETQVADPKRIRTEMGIPADAVVIGNVGTFNLRKGADLFIDSAALIVNEYDNVHFVWVGAFDKDELKNLLQRLTIAQKARMHFPGEIPHPYVYYKVFDILLLTSRDDPFPLTAMEAAYFFKPVICIRGTGGIPEVLHSPELVVAEANARDFFEICKPLILNRGLREKLGLECRKKLMDDLSIDRQMNRIIKIINSVIEHSPRTMPEKAETTSNKEITT